MSESPFYDALFAWAVFAPQDCVILLFIIDAKTAPHSLRTHIVQSRTGLAKGCEDAAARSTNPTRVLKRGQFRIQSAMVLHQIRLLAVPCQKRLIWLNWPMIFSIAPRAAKMLPVEMYSAALRV